MTEVFHFPTAYPGWWLDTYFYGTWLLSMLVLAIGWAVFFRYGKFTYAINLGCFWKTSVMLLLFVVTLGGPQYYNTRFLAEHGQDGDSVKLTDEEFRYLDRKGAEIVYPLAEVTAIYQEEVTYNPPPKVFIVASVDGVRDSVFVTKNLEGYERFLEELSLRTGIEAKLP